MKIKQFIITLCVAMMTTQTAVADIFKDVTQGQNNKITAEYFGLHFHRLVLRPNENAVETEWPALQVGSIRLWDSTTAWADIVPIGGQWNFERLDKYVDMAEQHHASVLYTLGSTPQWASARPNEKCSYGYGCAAEPIKMAHWQEYVRQVVQRYRGRIKAYELWNEPHFSDFDRDRGRPGFYTGSMEFMLEMAKIATKVIKDNDPDAYLISPGFVNGPDRLNMFLSNGGKKYVGAVAYHFYSENSNQLAKQILDVREIMKQNGISDYPIWNTETGVEVQSPQELPSGIAASNHVEAAQKLSQYIILSAAAGLKRFYYYAWDNYRSGMVTRTGERLPAYNAFAQVEKWLIGATMMGCESLSGSVVACSGVKDKRTFKIIWSDKPQIQAIHLPQGMHFLGQETLMGESTAPFKVVTGNVIATTAQAPTLLWFN